MPPPKPPEPLAPPMLELPMPIARDVVLLFCKELDVLEVDAVLCDPPEDVPSDAAMARKVCANFIASALRK